MGDTRNGSSRTGNGGTTLVEMKLSWAREFADHNRRTCSWITADIQELGDARYAATNLMR